MNIKSSYLFFFISTAAAITVRTLLLFFVIDTESGFLKSEYLGFSIPMLIVIIASVLLTFGFALTSKPIAKQTKDGGIALKILSPVLALVILYDTFFSTLEYSVIPWQKGLEVIFAVASAIVLILFAVSDFLHYSFSPVLNIAVIGFWLIRLFIIFTSFSSLANISDNMFELASLCLILLAFLQITKLQCLDIPKEKHKTTFAVSLVAAALCFITSVPRAIVTLSGSADILHTNDLPILTTLIAGIYILVNAYEQFPIKQKDLI